MILRLGEETRDVAVPGGDLRLVAVGPATFVLDQGDGESETFHCVRDGDVIHLSWQGIAYRLVVERKGVRSSGDRRGGGSLETPMPGKVIKVSVAPGQAVKKGDEILVVEAMKMENALRAPRDGVVKSVAVKVGDMADPGVPLAEIE